MSKEIENLHLQAFNRTVKDLLDVQELYMQYRLSGEKYDRALHENVLKECGLEIRQATLALFYALGMKYEWSALQRGIAELEAERELVETQFAPIFQDIDNLRLCKICEDRYATRGDGVCQNCHDQWVIDQM